MAESIGIDITEIARIERLLDRYGDRFLGRILGPDEQVIISSRRDSTTFVAGRFAAKEAVIKALGEYLTDRPPLSSLQILNYQSGRPYLKLPDALAAKLAGIRILVSLSHERNYAVGMAICMEKK